MIKERNVAVGVRVKLNDKWSVKCIGDEHLQSEPIIYICDNKVYNDQRGKYVLIKGASQCNSGYAYLDQLDLHVNLEEPLYHVFDDMKEVKIKLLLDEFEKIESELIQLNPNVLIERELKKLGHE